MDDQGYSVVSVTYLVMQLLSLEDHHSEESIWGREECRYKAQCFCTVLLDDLN